MNLAELLFGKPKMKGKISVEVDDEIEKAETKIFSGELESRFSSLVFGFLYFSFIITIAISLNLLISFSILLVPWKKLNPSRDIFYWFFFLL